MLTRRQFALGAAAMVSTSILDGGRARGAPAPLDTPLPIPALIDAEGQGSAVQLRVASAQHAFLKGKPTRTYGYSAPVLGPVIRVRRGDEATRGADCEAMRAVHLTSSGTNKQYHRPTRR
jgi:blue copper oxidase